MKPTIRVERPSLAAFCPHAGFGTLARVAAALKHKNVGIPLNRMMPSCRAETANNASHDANLMRLGASTTLDLSFNGDVFEERSHRLAADICGHERLSYG